MVHRGCRCCTLSKLLLGKLKGQRELTLNDNLLRLLALRQRQLLGALNARGHAATSTIQLDTPGDDSWREGKLPEALRRARAHPDWSSLNPGARLEQVERRQQVDALASELQR